MQLTRREALIHACPFAKNFDASNGGTPEEKMKLGDWKSPRCIADGCMAWNWVDGETQSAWDEEDLHKNFWSRLAVINEDRLETSEETDERITRVMTERGYKHNGHAVKHVHTHWTKPNLARRGECGRTHYVDIHNG